MDRRQFNYTLLSLPLIDRFEINNELSNIEQFNWPKKDIFNIFDLIKTEDDLDWEIYSTSVDWLVKLGQSSLIKDRVNQLIKYGLYNKLEEECINTLISESLRGNSTFIEVNLQDLLCKIHNLKRKRIIVNYDTLKNLSWKKSILEDVRISDRLLDNRVIITDCTKNNPCKILVSEKQPLPIMFKNGLVGSLDVNSNIFVDNNRTYENRKHLYSIGRNGHLAQSFQKIQVDLSKVQKYNIHT